jgi:hypothetical protein
MGLKKYCKIATPSDSIRIIVINKIIKMLQGVQLNINAIRFHFGNLALKTFLVVAEMLG